MPGHIHQDFSDQPLGKFDVYLHAKKKNKRDIAKILQTCYFGYFGHI